MATQLSEAEIVKLKKKHGDDLFLVEVASNKEGEEPLQFVFKKADRKTLSASAKVFHQDEVGAADVMIKNCLVWGDIALTEDVAVFSALASKIEEINKPRTATIKNL